MSLLGYPNILKTERPVRKISEILQIFLAHATPEPGSPERYFLEGIYAQLKAWHIGMRCGRCHGPKFISIWGRRNS